MPNHPTQPAPATPPTRAFVAASWAAGLAGTFTDLSGLWSVGMPLNEKGDDFTRPMHGLFVAAVRLGHGTEKRP